MTNDQEPRILSPEARAEMRKVAEFCKGISQAADDLLAVLESHAAMDAEVARLKAIITGIRTAFEKNGYLLLVPGDEIAPEISGLLDAIGKDHYRDVSLLSEKMKGLREELARFYRERNDSITVLAKRIQELEADKARLDWLESNCHSLTTDDEIWAKGDAPDWLLREAIDQARAGEKP